MSNYFVWLYFFTDAQIDQVAQAVLFKWAGQLSNLGSNKELQSILDR